MSDKERKDKKKFSENIDRENISVLDNPPYTINDKDFESSRTKQTKFIEDLERKWEGENIHYDNEKELLLYQKRLVKSLKKKLFKFR